MQGEDRRRRRRLVPPKFLSSLELCLPLSSRPWFFFLKLSLWGSFQEKVYCSRDIFKPQTIKFPRGSYFGKNRSHLKNQVFLGKLSTSRVYLGKKSVVWPQLITTMTTTILMIMIFEDYSFEIFLRLWLTKIPRIHHNQLLLTKFGRILRYAKIDVTCAA